MLEGLPRSQAHHQFNENSDPNKKGTCVECGKTEEEGLHGYGVDTKWCTNPRCRHPRHHHDAGSSSECHVQGCGCEEFTLVPYCPCGHTLKEHATATEEGPCTLCPCQKFKGELSEDFTDRMQALPHDILIQGREKVDGERQKEHGDPVQNLKRVATIWSALLGVQITAHDVAVCMGAFKKVRQMANPEHSDNLVDVAGYAEIAKRCVEAGEYIPQGTQRSLYEDSTDSTST